MNGRDRVADFADATGYAIASAFYRDVEAALWCDTVAVSAWLAGLPRATIAPETNSATAPTRRIAEARGDFIRHPRNIKTLAYSASHPHLTQP